MTAAICDTKDIQLGNLVFNTVDANGVSWVISDLEGWWGLPEPDIPDAPRGWEDGAYMTVGRYSSRIINVIGSFIPPKPELVSVARATLLQNLNLVRQSTYFMTHESDYTKGSEVQLSGAPSIATTGISGRTDFSFGLRAPDPIKYAFNNRTPPGYYSTARTGVGGLTVTNMGNYGTAPILSVSGTTTGPVTIINNTTGDRVEIKMPVINETLVIDNYERAVNTVGGAQPGRNKRFYLKWNTDWMELAPGPNALNVTGSMAGATLTVQWRHSWIG